MKHLGSDIGTCEMHPSLSHLVVQEHYGNHFYTYDPRVASLQVNVTCSTYTLPQIFEVVGYAGPFIYIRNPHHQRPLFVHADTFSQLAPQVTSVV